ncbi:MAG: hypothetical protein Q8Q08_11750 [Candidatus Omnitrophota bacterium]|nr:hypothetical protein [Candidatus Omnitrophota bacterium]MDZ4243180.1 hypothetical protein [Candidatus Omnitrophota bacterium]
MAAHPAEKMKTVFETVNPFGCRSESLPVNLVLMVKLIAVGLLMKGYLFDLSDHFLPYWPVFDGMGPPGVFRFVLQFFFLLGTGGILFSRAIRTGCLILGLVMLTTVLSSRTAYSNVKFFCSCLLLLTALADPKNPLLVLRCQMAIVYLGAWVNKIFDADWRSGQYFEHWMSAIIKRETYIQAAALLPPMVLSKMMGWMTIVIEAFLSAGFLLRPLRGLTIFTGIYFHSMAFLLAWQDFYVFTIATLSSYLILVPWPDRLTIRFNPQRRLHRAIKAVIEKVDCDQRAAWIPEQGRLQVNVFDGHYQGFLAFKRIVLYSPFFYFLYVFILGLPNESFLWVKLKTVQLALVIFFPWMEIIAWLKGAPGAGGLAERRPG